MCFAALCNTGSGSNVIQYQGYINYNYTLVIERGRKRDECGRRETGDREGEMLTIRPRDR